MLVVVICSPSRWLTPCFVSLPQVTVPRRLPALAFSLGPTHSAKIEETRTSGGHGMLELSRDSGKRMVGAHRLASGSACGRLLMPLGAADGIKWLVEIGESRPWGSDFGILVNFQCWVG
jgi:hypothetical protein